MTAARAAALKHAGSDRVGAHRMPVASALSGDGFEQQAARGELGVREPEGFVELTGTSRGVEVSARQLHAQAEKRRVGM